MLKIVWLVCGVLLVGLLAFALLWAMLNPNQYTLAAGHHIYHLAVARTPAQQAKGLGDRSQLAIDQGMVFVYRDQAVRCFWMKDMHFPLDIIWLNSDKQIVYIEPNISPSTYPKTFCPGHPANYVIELNAGQAKYSGMRTDILLKF